MDSNIFEATDLSALVTAAMEKREMFFETNVVTCGECGEGFSYRYLVGEPYTLPEMCCLCHDQEQERLETAAKDKQRVESTRRRRDVPTKYADNDTGRFPQEWSDVLKWAAKDGRGLGLIGDTGKCKTRMMFELMMNYREQTGTNFTAITSFRLGQLIQHQWKDQLAASELKQAKRAKILFLDDFGKQKFTEPVEAELFEIIEDRSKWLKPIMFTSNLVGRDFEKMMSENVCGPLLRRLREDCEIYTIK